MKTLHIAALCALFGALGASPSLASDIDNQITQISPSIIMIGIADPCANGACDEEVAAASAQRDRNAPLVNANGMPTGETVIMRPSVETTAVQATVNPATITETPAAATETAAAPQAEPTDAPVIAADEAPAPRKSEDGERPKGDS